MPVVDLIALCVCIPRLVTLALCPLGGSTLYASKSCGRASLALAFENALQIAQYFQQYSLLSQSMKSECAELLQNLERTLFLHSEYIVNVTGNDVCTEGSCSVQSCDDVWDAYSAYFADVKSIARRQWTAFNIPCMVVGLCVVAFVCILLMFFLDVDLRKVISSRRSVTFFNLAFPFFFNARNRYIAKFYLLVQFFLSFLHFQTLLSLKRCIFITIFPKVRWCWELWLFWPVGQGSMSKSWSPLSAQSPASACLSLSMVYSRMGKLNIPHALFSVVIFLCPCSQTIYTPHSSLVLACVVMMPLAFYRASLAVPHQVSIHHVLSGATFFACHWSLALYWNLVEIGQW